MERTIFVTFAFYTMFGEDGSRMYKHFNPNDITRKLNTIPIHTQNYEPNFTGNVRSRIPSNAEIASWIYRVGNSEIIHVEDLCPQAYVEELLEELDSQLFNKSNKQAIKDILAEYDAYCYLEIYTFGFGNLIESITVPSSVLLTIGELGADLEVNTHSEPLSHYLETAYKYKHLFES
ncbi:DUF4279 domain-containing protein [Ralstonia pickettii]|nr:DUF4279 domain-containing protein [Ralstonia pickettii]